MKNTIDGFTYISHFISEPEEQSLVEAVRTLALERLYMRGQLTHRRVTSFGLDYDGRRSALTPAAPLPDAFAWLQRRTAEQVGIDPERLRQALITEYPAKAKIGAHIDNKSFGLIICGISLIGDAVMTLEHSGMKEKLAIARRSMYVLRDAARWYRHEVVAREHRYSITLRTVAADE